MLQRSIAGGSSFAVAYHRWMLPLLGLCLISLGLRCDARAVNVSNTWTMPQEGLNVFYRFFRDRISWFEADAVCQFHHANLVTVDNSFQFDATRDLLRELDVNDIVWIGLMRPQNSERFMWSNSRPLVTDTGYWAESLPLMDAPLCAVIDPIRDYRWHALRCGGPETASFLCEMPVPSWADACILKDMPNLTMQYMADTASIELIRNCQEEGLLRHTCKGKEDRERAIRQLICPKERLEAQRITDMTNSHFKSLQIIQNIRTDNNENNDIDLLPLQPNYNRGNPEIAVAPPPTSLGSATYGIPHEIPRPVKKSGPRQPPPEHIDIMSIMMGDQPALSMEQLPDSGADVSNEIFEHLPHKKKILQQDLKTLPSIVEATTKFATTTTTATPTTEASLPITTNSAAHTTHLIESSDNSHFIPPMLMVKSHYIPPAKHGEHLEHGEHIEHLVATSTAATLPTQQANDKTTIVTSEKSMTVAAAAAVTITTTVTPTTDAETKTTVAATSASTTTAATATTTAAAVTATAAGLSTTTSAPTTTTTSPGATTTASIAAATTSATTWKIAPTERATSTSMATERTVTSVKADTKPITLATSSPPAAAATTAATTASATTTTTAATATTTVTKVAANDLKLNSTTTVVRPSATATTTPVTAATLPVILSTPAVKAATVTNKAKEALLVTETEEDVASTITTAAAAAAAAPSEPSAAAAVVASAAAASATTVTTPATTTTTTTTRRNFLQEETEAPFKPNRRRSLTKPETVSYFKKILG